MSQHGYAAPPLPCRCGCDYGAHLHVRDVRRFDAFAGAALLIEGPCVRCGAEYGLRATLNGLPVIALACGGYQPRFKRERA